jgi:hypothetical protein
MVDGGAVTGIETLLQQVYGLGAHFKIEGERVSVLAPSPLPPDLMAQLRLRKAELRTFLETSVEDLPFPMGYGGLPMTQVELAEVINDKFGITDPVHRKYNVLAWVRGYYQDRAEDHGDLYEAIKREQQRLGEILDEDHE